MLPKVSICIPAYNAEEYIYKCIDSVLKQKYDNLEIILIDDASTDNTAKIVKQFSDIRIKYFKNENNLGWRGNVRKCYELASGEFVTMLPVDDYLIEGFIEKAVEIFLKYDNVGIWAAGNITINESGIEIGKNFRPKQGLIKYDQYFRYTFTMQNISPPSETMIRKKCFDEVDGYRCYKDDIYKQFPEIKLYLMIAERGYDAFHSGELFTYRTSRSTSLSAKYGNKAFVLQDNYNIFYEYKDNPLLNRSIIESTNKSLSFSAIKIIKVNMFINAKETLSALRILYKRDYLCTGKSIVYKTFYLFKLFFNTLRRKTI